MRVLWCHVYLAGAVCKVGSKAHLRAWDTTHSRLPLGRLTLRSQYVAYHTRGCPGDLLSSRAATTYPRALLSLLEHRWCTAAARQGGKESRVTPCVAGALARNPFPNACLHAPASGTNCPRSPHTHAHAAHGLPACCVLMLPSNCAATHLREVLEPERRQRLYLRLYAAGQHQLQLLNPRGVGLDEVLLQLHGCVFVARGWGWECGLSWVEEQGQVLDGQDRSAW